MKAMKLTEQYNELRTYGEIIEDKDFQTMGGQFVRLTTFKYNGKIYTTTKYNGTVYAVCEVE